MAGRKLVDKAGVATPLSTSRFPPHTALLERTQIALTRDQIVDLSQRRRAVPFDRLVDNQVSRLRKERDRVPTNPELIATVRGRSRRIASKVSRE